MNKRYEITEISTLDLIRYEEGSERYEQATEAFMRGKTAFADEEFELAKKLFRKAIDCYYQIENPNLKKTLLTDAYFNLIGSLAQNQKSDPNEAIKAIDEAKALELVSEDWNLQLSAAYYNSGIKQIDSESKAKSFSQAKYYNPTNPKVIYCLGLAYIAQGKHDQAKREFEELLSQKWPEEKFSLEMQLNSWCQLKQCQSELYEDISNTLKFAWAFIKDLPQAFFMNVEPEIQVSRHEMANDIYIEYITKNLDEIDIQEFVNFFNKFSPDIVQEALESLDNQAFNFLQGGNKEDAERLGEFAVNVGKSMSLGGEDSVHAD